MQDYIEKSKKKKKKDDHSSKGRSIRNFQIIDDDININDLRTTQESEILVDLLDPEGPSIVYDAIPEEKPKDDSKNKWIKLDFLEKETEEEEEVNNQNLFKKRSIKSAKTISKDFEEKIKQESDFNSKIRENKTELDDDDLDMIPRQRRSIENDLSPARRKPKTDVDSDQDLDYIPRIKKERLSPESSKNLKHEVKNTDENKVRIRKPTKEEELKKSKESALKAKYADWKKGLTQKKEKEEKIADFLYESEKPLARYADDKDLDNLLKKQEREDDPMLAYLKKNKPDEKKEGEKPKQKYRGPPALPNRYNIHPGSKWDGVDRSNGFEKKYFESINAKKVFQEEAYKWSTEDM